MRIETADRQYEVRTLNDGVVHIEEPHILPFYRCNTWFVHGRLRTSRSIIVIGGPPVWIPACRRTGIGLGARGRAGRSGRRPPRARRARVACRQMTMRSNTV